MFGITMIAIVAVAVSMAVFHGSDMPNREYRGYDRKW